MGQRSLFVARYATQYSGTLTRHRIARHLHWNFGPYMILRAAQVVRLMGTINESGSRFEYNAHDNMAGVTATFCVNQTTGVTQGMGRHDDQSRSDIARHDNNNGAFLIDVDADGAWHFGFLVGREDGGDLATVVNAHDYMTAAGITVAALRNRDTQFAQSVADALIVLDRAEVAGHQIDQAAADAMATGNRNEPLRAALSV